MGDVQDAVHVKVMSYTAARESLAATMDEVCEDRKPVVITRKRDQSVVMMSLADFEAFQETAYLLRSPKNARRLLDSIKELESGRGIPRDLELDQ